MTEIKTILPTPKNVDAEKIEAWLVRNWPAQRTSLDQNLKAIHAAASRQEQQPPGLNNFLTVTRVVINQYPDQLPYNLRVILPDPDRFTPLKARLSLHLPNRQHGAANIFWDELTENQPPRLTLTIHASIPDNYGNTYRYILSDTQSKGWAIGLRVQNDRPDRATGRYTFRPPMGNGEDQLMFKRLNQYAQVLAPSRPR